MNECHVLYAMVCIGREHRTENAETTTIVNNSKQHWYQLGYLFRPRGMTLWGLPQVYGQAGSDMEFCQYLAANPLNTLESICLERE